MADNAGIINTTTGGIVEVKSALVETSPGVWQLQAAAPGYVPTSRTISTTAPLTGGGDLSADRTLAISAASALTAGSMSAADYSKLAAATASDTASTIMMRDASQVTAIGGLQIDTAPAVVQTGAVGKVVWNDNDGTLEFQVKGGQVTLQIGEEQLIRVVNKTGTDIGDGVVVYLTGAQGQRPKVALAKADAEVTSATTIGVTTEAIAKNAEGFVTISGLVHKIDMGTALEGDILYLSPTTAGAFTSTKPVAPEHMVTLGLCVVAGTQGTMLVAVQNGYELDELHNVLITGVAAGDILIRNAGNTLWENKPQSNLAIAESQVTNLTTDLGNRVLKAGDTMTGDLTLGSGASLKLTGGSSSGQGNIQLGATAAAGYDTNVLYLDSTAKMLGFVAGSTPAFVGAYGPFFGARGNTYSAIANQRGNMFFFAGSPSTPGASEGQLWFGTTDIVRLLINKDGKFTLNNGTTSGTALFNIAGSLTAYSTGDPSVIKVTTALTALANGDAYHTYLSPAVVKQNSGTHANVIGILISAPAITGGAATVTNAASVVILGAPTAGTSTNYALWIQGGAVRFDGNVSIAVATPTARLHLPAGTATAGTAPLKFSSGTLNTAAEVGAVEFDGTSFFGSTSFRSAFVRGVKVDASLTPTVVAANSASVQTYTVTGLVVPHAVTVSPPSLNSGLGIMWARCSASDTLEICWRNFTGGDLTPASGFYRVSGVRV